jgi:hypothetical protein
VTTIAIILGILFALLCGAAAMVHSLRVGRMTLLDWSLLALGGMYGLGWALVVAVTQAGGNPTWERWITPFETLYPVHTFAALLATLGVVLGWYVPSSLLPLRSAKQVSTQDVDARPWVWAFWTMLVLAMLLQGLYTRAYGGFLGVLDYSALIRSALFDRVANNPFSFLQPFGGLAMIAAYGFFGLWLSGRRNIGIALGLALSFTFSLYILYSFLGRMGFLIFLAAFPLGVSLARRRNPLKLILWGLVLFMAILVASYGVSVWLNLKAAGSLTVFLVREISFPFGSFFAQLSNGEHLFRGFIDFVVAPVYLLPSSLWTSWLEPVGQVNTAVIMGAPKGQGGVTGGIPVDLLTLGFMQIHIVGVFLGGLLFGGFLRVLQSVIDQVPLDGVRGILEAHVALKIAVLGVFYAQPNLVVSGNFALIFGAAIVLFMLTVTRVRFFPFLGRRQILLRKV